MTQIELSQTADSTRLPVIQRELLNWFTDNARDLPWRRTRNPYHILVSEIMLQQTQVDRVLPKYRAFLEQFPTLEELAVAPTSEVIRAWAGLGYNRRAVNLQRAARAILEAHAGEFPRDVKGLQSLPGIGPYTAGAVACFAFEQDVGFMDTNIQRVLQRLFFGTTPASVVALQSFASQIVPPSQGWAWNQALMELGALLCTARQPLCWQCPVRDVCRDYAERRQADMQIFEAVTSAPRQVAERRETPYLHSNRYFRGRVIDALRALEADQGLPLTALGAQIKADFTNADLPWIQRIAEGLARDGLIVLNGDQVSLPQ